MLRILTCRGGYLALQQSLLGGAVFAGGGMAVFADKITNDGHNAFTPLAAIENAVMADTNLQMRFLHAVGQTRA